MKKFKSNIINIYGQKGNAWLTKLPELVNRIAAKLKLHDLRQVNNLCYNYVLSGFQGDKPIILKIGFDYSALEQEAFALQCFANYDAVKVLAEDKGMLLLERAIPGTSLKNYFPEKESEAIEITCNVIKKLHQAPIPKHHSLPHIKDWLSILDKDWNIPSDYLQKARQIRDQLLKTTGQDILLHGDLHHDNILQNDSNWMVIDPKGVIGDPAYEVVAFIRNPIPDLLQQKNVIQIINYRIAMFSNNLNIPQTKIVDWCFVQAIVAWAWALEDGLDTSYFQKITAILI